jgi:hypothetical protein
MSALVAFGRLLLGSEVVVLESDPVPVEEAVKERVRAEAGLIGGKVAVRRGEHCQVARGGWVNSGNTGEEQLA